MLVDSGFAMRGGQLQVKRLASGLVSLGYRVFLLAPEGSWLARRSPPGASLVPWSSRSDLDLRAALSLAIAAKRRGVPLVHAHDARSHAAARWAQLLGWRGTLVVTRRSCRTPRGGLKYRRGVARYIAISRAVEQSLRRAGVPRDRIDLVPSGVRSNLPRAGAAARKILRTLAGATQAELTIVAAGALTAEKRFDVLTEAAAIAGRWGLKARWIVFGDGPLRPDLEERARAAGAPVRFAGFFESAPSLLQAADLMVHPSESEGLGTAVLEAMAAGVPVVASRTGELQRLVPRAGGLTVAPGRPAELAEAVIALLSDSNRLSRARRDGPRVARRFSVERMVRGTVRTYKKALEMAKERA
ncbi:Alpha-D-kanosaminyltransferase [bacterium HR33]|nr:Alpha-D-kanosaminyltransferase [bacterium HR33]